MFSGELSGEDKVLDLIGAIYDVALDAELWPDLLNRIGDAVGGPQFMFGFYDVATGISEIHASRFDPEVVRSCVEMGAHNPLPDLSAAEAPGKVFTVSDFFTPDEFKNTTFYREWWRPAGLSLEPLTTNLLVDGGAAAIFTSNRAADRSPPDSRQKRLFAVLAQHLVRAVALQRRLYQLSFANENALTALDSLQQGFLLVDGEARPLFVNREAQALIDAQDGIRLDGGALFASDDDDGRALRGIIASCAAEAGSATGSGGEVTLRRASGRRPLEILAMPARQETAVAAMSWTIARRPAAIVLVSDPDKEIRAHIESLRERFGLTPAEAILALEIVKGDGRQATADRLGISVGTARTHLSKIFNKTGATRQAELVRLLLQK